MEPYEDAVIEVPEEHVGGCVDLLGGRKGQMLDLQVNSEGLSKLKYKIPTRCARADELHDILHPTFTHSQSSGLSASNTW